jgi:hypothetical protein
MKRNALFFLILMLLVSIAAWADQVIVGTGTTTQRQPLAFYFGYERSAALYTSAEIGLTGDISVLEWYPTVALSASTPVKIYMKTTTSTTITSDTWANTIAGATLVYDGSFNVTATGWYPITFTSNYSYLGGTQNLMVLVETNYGGNGEASQNSAGTACRYSSATSQHEIWYQDNSIPTGVGTVASNRPNIRITITNPLPMAYTSSTTSQNTATVWAGDTQQEVIGIQVVMTGNLSPLNLTQLQLNTTGTTSVSEISNAKIFYTGTTSTFSATSQFGATVAAPSGTYLVNGTQTLSPGTNYFWLTYDISASAVATHLVDAECTSLSIVGIPHVPAITAPAGARTIQVPLTGIKTVGAGGNYTTLTAAINDLNSLGVGAGGVTFNITSAATFTEDLPVITATGAADRIILFKTTAAGHAIVKPTFTTGTSSDAGIAINGGDYITFNGIDITENSGSAVEYGYYIYGGAQHITIINTSITLNSTNSSSRAIYSYSNATTAAAANSYNHFYNIAATNIYSGIYINGSDVAGAEDTGNEVGISSGTTLLQNLGSATGSTYVYGIYMYSQTAAKVFSSTVLTANSQTGSIYGIYLGGSANTVDVYSNTVRALASSSTGTCYGIYLSSGTTANIYQNTIRTLTSANSATYGVYIYGGTANNIYRNLIYDFTYSGTGAGYSYGINLQGGTTNNVYNNMIYGMKAVSSTGTPGVCGIFVNSGTTDNIYYNSVLLNETATALNIWSSALYVSTTPSTVDIRNNIFVNNSAVGTGGTGGAVAFARNGAGYSNLAATTNNNLYYAGVPDAQHLIHFDGTTSFQTLANYKAAISTKDQLAVTENVPFRTPDTTYQIHIALATATQVESGGLPITTPINIAVDYDGGARNATTPDIGADEGTFLILDIVPPTIAYSILPNSASTTSATLTGAVITDLSGVNITSTTKPRVYYKKSTDANVFGGNTSGSNGWKWTETAGSASPFDFILDYSKLQTLPVIGETIQYFVVAQDLATTPNVAASPSVGFVGTTVAAITSAPTTPNSYQIITAFSGTKTIGSGGNYATITAALAVLNTAVVTGPVEFRLLNTNYSSGETFPLTINNIPGASATNTITFKPAPGVTGVLITGTNATAIWNINGTTYFTIDGSNNNTTSKDLTIVNASTTAPVINFTGTAANNTVKNCTINGANTSLTNGLIYVGTTSTGNSNSILSCDLGVGASAPAIGVYLNGSATGSQTVQGCTIKGMTQYGLYIGNSSSNGVLVQQNTIRDFGAYGIYGFSGSGIIINKCDLYSTSITSSTLGGIFLGNLPGVIVKKCKIHNLVGSATAALTGIFILGDNLSENYQIYNNEIYLETGVATTTGSVRGIDYWGQTLNSVEIYFNSVYIGGTGVTAGNSYAFYKRAEVSTIKVEDNIFMNARTNSTGTGKHYAISWTNIVYTTLLMNRNDYFAGGNGGILGLWTSTPETTIAAWRLASTQDANSIDTNPSFSFGAAYLRPYTSSTVFSIGVPITGITDDILDGIRSVSLPTLGAYETGVAGGALTTPTNLHIALVGSSKVLTWNAVAGATGYRVYWTINPTVPSWTILASPSTNSYTDTGSNAYRFYCVSATQ